MRDAALLGALAFASACQRPADPIVVDAPPRPAPAVASTPVQVAQAPVAAPRTAGAAPTLAVYTLSRGKGVPDETRATLTRIRELLDAARKDQRVTAVQSSRIGIEGEARLCVEFRDAAAAAELGNQVRALARDVELLNVVDENCRTGEKQP